jgi:hypothetical protein
MAFCSLPGLSFIFLVAIIDTMTSIAIIAHAVVI